MSAVQPALHRPSIGMAAAPGFDVLLAAALRTARQASRGTAGRTLLAALLLAVVAVTAVALVGARIGGLMQRSAQDFLGADLVLASAEPVPDEWRAEARRRGLAQTAQQIFPSMVFGAERGQLAEIKSVEAGYPLRGQVELADPAAPTMPRRVQDGPAAGTAWLAPDLARALDLEVGDSIDLGERSLLVAALLQREPDRGGGVFSFAPRVLVQATDLAESGLLGPGSRVSHRLLLAGPALAIAAYEDWLQPRLEGRARLQTLADSQQALSQALARALSFLRLAVLCSVLLAGVALLLAARRYAELEQGAVALLKTLGWTAGQLLLRYGMALLLLAWGVGAAGVLLAAGIERLAVAALAIPELSATAAPSLLQGWIGLALATGLLLACVLPSVRSLCAVPPLAVFKQERSALPQLKVGGWLAPLLLLFGLAWLATDDFRLAAVALGGMLLGLGLVALLAYALLKALPRTVRASWRLGIAKYRNAPLLGVVQITALAAGFAALALVGVLSRDLLQTWKLSLADDTPNYFLINVRSEQLPDLLQRLTTAGSARLTHAPVAVGRLRAINGTAVESYRVEGVRAGDRLQRNQNLSWAAEPGVGNELVAGRWFSDDGIAEVSAATSWATPLGVKLGDRLQLAVGEQQLEVTVSSLRDVAWDSFAVNFFLVLEPAAASTLAHGHLVSFHLPPANRAALDPVLRDAPNLSLIDVQAVLSEVRQLIERASLAVRLVFWFSVAAGLLVLLAAFNATLDERLREAAVLRALGATARQLRGAILGEFAAIGAVAGLFAAGLAWAVGMLVAERVFGLPLATDWLALGLVALGATALAVLLGGIAAERLLRIRAIDALRRV